MAGLCAPLSTLRQYPRGYLRMTRGRCGSLLLHRDGLAPSTPCRSPGALRSSPNNKHLVRLMPILLQKSKIRRSQKSRESRFRDIAVAARLRGADTKVRGRFGVKRYGPSHREARDASAALKISVHHPKNTFATKSERSAHGLTCCRLNPVAIEPNSDIEPR